MAVELPKDQRREAIATIVHYFRASREEDIGLIAAGGLLDCFLENIGPSIYNKAVADVLKRMQGHISAIDIDFHEEEFPFSSRPERWPPA